MAKSETQEHKHNTRKQPELTRRGMIKTIGAAGGVAAVGSGAMPSEWGISPVGKSEALAPFAAGLAVGIVAGGMGGIAAIKWKSNAGDVDEDQILEDQIYNAAESVATGRDEFVKEIDANFNNVGNADATPFANAAWSEVRVEAARARLEGEAESTAVQRAKDKVDKQLIRSIVNMVERWNTGVKALSGQIAYQLSDSDVSVLAHSNIYDDPAYLIEPSHSYPWEKSRVTVEVDGTTYETMAELKVDEMLDGLPLKTDSIESREEPLTVFALEGSNDHVNHPFQTPDNGSASLAPFSSKSSPAGDNDNCMSTEILATHSTFDRKKVIDSRVLHKAMVKIETAYNNIQNDLSTYIGTLYDSFSEGALDPAAVIGPKELYDNFANSSQQQRMTAELLAVGAAHPGEDVGYRVKVDHADLQDPPQWGRLYPLFADGVDSVAIESGTTIPASDYKMAYLGYEAADTGEWYTQLLSGESADLTILETEGNDTDIESERSEQTAGTNGKVLVWDTSSPENGGQGEAPDPLKYPQDHGDWFIEVRGASNLHTAQMTAPTVQSGDNGNDQYILDSTDLSEGELVESVAIKKAASYEQTTRYVSDPTQIDQETLEQRVQTYDDLRQAIEKLKNTGPIGGGGGLFDGGLPTLPGLGVIESAAVVILGILGLNAASS